MKKKFLILPLLALLLVGCGGGGGDNGEKPPVVTTGDGTLANPYTAEEALVEAKKLAATQNGASGVYVTGNVVSGIDTYNKATPNIYNGRVSFHLSAGNESLLVYNANDASGANSFTDSPVVAGDTVVVFGVLKHYSSNSGVSTYQVCYVNGVDSCNLLTVNGIAPSTGGSSTGGGSGDSSTPDTTGTAIAGDNASNTGTVPSSAKTLKLDFTGGTISGITATSSSKPQASGTATVNGYEFNFVNAIAHDASAYVSTGYLGLCGKGATAAASFSNKTPIPGKIKKVEFTMPTEISTGSVSALAPFIIDFGTSVLSTTTHTGGQTGGSGVTLSAYPTSDCSYFSISCVQGISSTGKATWYNGYIASITISYVD